MKRAWTDKLLLLALALAVSATVQAAAGDALKLPKGALIQPQALVQLLAKAPAGKAPLLLQVGFHPLYQQAHIPGSVYAGPTNQPEGLERFVAALKGVPKGRDLVLYCGCCPWQRCPNVAAAYAKTRELGYTKVKVLYIAKNFGADWVDQGYPSTDKD